MASEELKVGDLVRPSGHFAWTCGPGNGRKTPRRIAADIYDSTGQGFRIDCEGRFVWYAHELEKVYEATPGCANPGPAPDLVKEPAHYTRFPIQPKDFIAKNALNFQQGSAIKYTCRAGHKLYPGKSAAESAVIDLEKAIENLKTEIARWSGEG